MQSKLPLKYVVYPSERMHFFQLGPRGRKKAAAAAAAVRSESSPRHSGDHLLARLEDGIHTVWTVTAFISSSTTTTTPTDVTSSGLGRVDAVLAVLRELLELPEAVKALRDVAASGRVLDGFLVLADAYGTLVTVLLALKQHAAELQAATRRGDGARLAAALRACRRAEKQLRHLAAAVRDALRGLASPSRQPTDTADTEVVGIVAEAAAAASAASEAIFLGCAAMSRALSSMVQAVSSKKWMARLGIVPAATMAAPETTVERLEELKESIGELESGSEKVFRGVVRTRVSLLNIQSSTLSGKKNGH